MKTLADRIREAREAQTPQGRTMGLMQAAVAGDGMGDLTAGLPEEIAARIPPPRGPMSPDNPSARCDYCPRVQAADMLLEVGPNRYACDACYARAMGTGVVPWAD